MSTLRLKRIGEDSVRLSGIDLVTAAILCEVPKILLQTNDPVVRARLFPEPSGDEKMNQDWKQFVTPELEHLFESARETFSKDIAPVADLRDPLEFREITFPLSHCDAWVNAVNGARLVLGTKQAITEEDYDQELVSPGDPKQSAMFRLDFLAELLFVFIQFLSPRE